MSKAVKNLLLVFTLVCLIVLVVFTVELFLLNRNGGDVGEVGPQLSAGVSDDAATAPESPPPSPPDNTTEPTNTEEPPTETPVRPVGRRYDMLVSSDRMLVWHVDEELFEYTHMDSGVMFTYADDEGASLEICPAHIPYGAEERAETFLDGYLEGNESFVGGIGPIRNSELTGVFVSGVKDGETFEAWIYDIEDDLGDMGVAFIIRYWNDEQKNALYDILDSISVTTA